MRGGGAKPSQPYGGPLSGVRVLDLTRVLAGPYATMILADLGADVVKIEDVRLGDPARATFPLIEGTSNHFLNLNRSKRSVALDMRSEAGREQILKLVRTADVVVENFRPGVLERLKLDFSDLAAVNERVILCSISGFGQDSSYRDRPSYDVITQALSGAMSVTGEVGRPPVRLGVPMGDLAGGLFGALATLGALFERSVTGRGQRVDVSMLDGLVHLMLYYPVDYLNSGIVGGPVGGRHEHIAPYGVFEAGDGYIVLAIFHGKFWRLYCDCIGRRDLLGDGRFRSAADRLKNRADLYPILDEVMRRRSKAAWLELFEKAGVPAAPVLPVDEVTKLAPLVERGMFVEQIHPHVGRIFVSGRPFAFPDRQMPELRPAPMLGEHTREVLKEWGDVHDHELLRLRSMGVVDWQ